MLAPDGRKVRCSKCGHVWRAMPGEQAAPSAGQPAAAMPPTGKPVADVSPEGVPQAGQPAEQVEPLPPAGGDNDREDSKDAAEESELAVKTGETDSPKEEELGPDGLTDSQRAKLAAARQQKPRSWFWIKVLTIFIIVAGLLLVAQRMLPPGGLKKADLTFEQPADPEKGGAKVDGEPPLQ